MKSCTIHVWRLDKFKFGITSSDSRNLKSDSVGRQKEKAKGKGRLCFEFKRILTPSKTMWFQTDVQKRTHFQVMHNNYPSLFKLPFLPAHGALLLHLLRVQPFQDAVHVKAVGTLTPDQRAVVSRHFTCRTSQEVTFQSQRSSTERKLKNTKPLLN